MFGYKASLSKPEAVVLSTITVKKGESSTRTNRTDLIRAPWLLHEVNREKVNRAESSGLEGGSKIIGWPGKNILVDIKKSNKNKKRTNHENNMEAKAMIKKPFAKICYTELIRWYYHGRTGSRPPIGVTMMQVSQVPKWLVAYMPDQEA